MAEDADGRDATEAPSKSARKREMTARQDLGEALSELTPAQLAAIPVVDPRLREALEEARHVTARSARRRHLQYIGKLMRAVDPAPLQAALDALDQQRAAGAAEQRELEELRDALLAEGDAAIPDILTRFPKADRQHLRQLARRAAQEAAREQPPAAARKLFRYLRELRSASP